MSPIPVNLDDLSRDPDDGSYHCPDCDAPFTRRSNLRRHFVIHTRDMPYQCTVCTQPFSRSEELHYHSLQCTDQSWDGPMLQALLNTTLNSNSPGDLNDSQHSPSFFGPDTVPSSPSASSSSSTHEVDQAFLDFMSSIAPSSTPTAPQPHEPMYGNPRLGTPSAINTAFSPAASPIAGASNEAQARLLLRRRSKPYDTARRKTKGNPVYTRRQVDDMLDAVSACFMSTIEKVSMCAGTTAQPRVAETHGLRPEAFPRQPDLGLQHALLQEPLPCLVDGL